MECFPLLEVHAEHTGSPAVLYPPRVVVDRLWRIGLWIAYRLQLVYWFCFRPTEPSAHVAVWWRGDILITRSPYRAHTSMPAGRVKRGEETRAAACRELHEEVGLHATPGELEPAGMIVSNQQFKRDEAHVFELHLAADATPNVEIDRREIIAAEFVSPARALAGYSSMVLHEYLARRISAARADNR